MRGVTLAAGALVSTIAATAFARPSARLVYSRAVGAESCPDEAALRAKVAERIGYDPFFPWIKQTVVVSMAAAGKSGFSTAVHLIDDRGFDYGARELHTEGACTDLLESTALVIAIAIDPQAIGRPAAVVAPSPPPAADPAPVPQPAPASASASPAPSPSRDVPEPVRAPEPGDPSSTQQAGTDPFRVSGLLGIVGSVGSAPSPTVGVALGAEVGWRAVSLGIDGRVDAPASKATSDGTVSTWLAVASLAPCAHVGLFSACALAQMGTMQASGQAAGASSHSLLWLAAGGRLGLTFPLDRGFGLRLRGDLVGDIGPPNLYVNGSSGWNAPPVAAAVAVDVMIHFR